MPAAPPRRRGPGRPLLPLALALTACFASASAQIPTLAELRAAQVAAAVQNASFTSPLGRKDLSDSCPATETSAVCPDAATPTAPAPTNTTLPFSLEDLGYMDFGNRNTTESDRRRRVLTTVYHAASSSYCKISRDVLLQGGRLVSGVSAIKDVPTPAACCARCAFISGCEAWTWSRRTKICYPKGAEGWKSVPSNLHVSGSPRRPPVRPAPTPAPLKPKPATPGTGRLLWEGKLVEGDHQLRRGFAKDIKIVEKANNKAVIADPTGTSSAPVIRVKYNAGCWAPEANCGGGALFYAWPNGRDGSIGEAARLEYEVYFPERFTFVKGGKLPGLQGGPMGCGGGADAGALKCWSVRLMWRREGEGEAYIYVDPAKQASDFCTGPGTVCDAHAGTSLERGRFTFKRGAWNKIALTVRMNDLGKKNGVVQLDVDGDTKILYEKMVYRMPNEPNLNIDSFIFASWFGGSDKSWAPSSQQEAYFRNFKIFNLD